MKLEAASSVLKNMACLMGVRGRWQACLGRTHATLFIFKASILPSVAPFPSFPWFTVCCNETYLSLLSDMLFWWPLAIPFLTPRLRTRAAVKEKLSFPTDGDAVYQMNDPRYTSTRLVRSVLGFQTKPKLLYQTCKIPFLMFNFHISVFVRCIEMSQSCFQLFKAMRQLYERDMTEM